VGRPPGFGVSEGAIFTPSRECAMVLGSASHSPRRYSLSCPVGIVSLDTLLLRDLCTTRAGSRPYGWARHTGAGSLQPPSFAADSAQRPPMSARPRRIAASTGGDWNRPVVGILGLHCCTRRCSFRRQTYAIEYLQHVKAFTLQSGNVIGVLRRRYSHTPVRLLADRLDTVP